MLSLLSAPSLRSLLALSTSALMFAGCAAEEAPTDDDSEQVETGEAEYRAQCSGSSQWCSGNTVMRCRAGRAIPAQPCGSRARCIRVSGGSAWCQGDDGPAADCEPGQCRGHQTCSGGTWVNVSCAERAQTSKVHCRANGYCG